MGIMAEVKRLSRLLMEEVKKRKGGNGFVFDNVIIRSTCIQLSTQSYCTLKIPIVMYVM